MLKLSTNADRALLFEYVRAKGMPANFKGKTDSKAVQIAVFAEITGLSEFDALAAYAECEDAGMMGTEEEA